MFCCFERHHHSLHRPVKGVGISQWIYTVRREDIEDLQLLDLGNWGDRFIIRIKASGKVQVVKDNLIAEPVDELDIHTSLKEVEVKWLYRCMRELATAKEI